VVSSGGKLTVALYTIRPVAVGEELTFDYACVTESEDEFKQAFCMCSTRHCRGSYLYYTGSKTFMQVDGDSGD
jgi:SET domain-containing protein